MLFTSSTHSNNYEDADIVVYSMASGQRKTVQRGGFYARYLPSGHVVYMHEGTLFAVPFDLKRLEVTGQPAPILEGVVTTPAMAGRSSPFPRPETSCMSRVAAGVRTSPSTGWTARANSRPSARLPAATSIPRSPPTGSVWLWKSMTAKGATSGCTSGNAMPSLA